MSVDEKSPRKLERFFGMPLEQHAAPPPNHKVAFVVWVAVFPTVLSTSILTAWIPFEMPIWLSVFIITAASVPPVVYILLLRLCRVLEPWIYKTSEREE